MSRFVFPCLMLVLALAACATPPGGGAVHGDAALEAACRQRADEVYDRQNRPAIYSPASGVNSPFSGNYSPAVTDRGLSDLYARDTMIQDCIRNTGTGTDRVAQRPSAAASAPISSGSPSSGSRSSGPPSPSGASRAGPPPGQPPARR